MDKYKRIALIMVILLTGLTSTYEATYTDVHVVLECFPWWYPAYMSVSIVGTNAEGEIESILIG